MKLHEVLTLPAVAAGEMWFRPVGWEFVAWSVSGGVCIERPALKGDEVGITLSVDLLTGEWEAVTPAEVLK